MSVYQNLVKARARIAEDKNWTIGTFHIPEREAFCAVGALGVERICDVSIVCKELELLAQVAMMMEDPKRQVHHQPTPHRKVFRLNDSYGHEQVLQMYDNAIALAAEREQVTEQIFSELEPELAVDHTELVPV